MQRKSWPRPAQNHLVVNAKGESSVEEDWPLFCSPAANLCRDSWLLLLAQPCYCRLARLRIYHGKCIEPYQEAFEALLEKMDNASQGQQPRDMATMLWSIAKLNNLEKLRHWPPQSRTYIHNISFTYAAVSCLQFEKSCLKTSSLGFCWFLHGTI